MDGSWGCAQQDSSREVLDGGEGGSGTQKFVYQKRPDQMSPIVNFVFPTMATLVWRG